MMRANDMDVLRRDVRFLKAYAVFATAVMAVLPLVAFRTHSPEPQIIRARGLIIEDAAGRERILIGAPIPVAKNRVRTDLERVRAIWGPRFPKQYLDWYAKYRNEVNGMLVLDANGFDRVAIGDSLPDPNIGKRIATSAGIVINDAQGFERTGWGVLRLANGDYRVDLGLDKATDAVSLLVDDASNSSGVNISDGKRSLFLGIAPANSPYSGLSTPLRGLVVRDSGGTREALFGAVPPK
jgi:hypothetical protein